MSPADSGVGGTRDVAARFDPESAEWLRLLAGAGPRREAALARLHEMLVRIAQGEVARRGPRLRITGPELDDVAYQAAADALVAITSKLGGRKRSMTLVATQGPRKGGATSLRCL